jgi:hypothetical protein
VGVYGETAALELNQESCFPHSRNFTIYISLATMHARRHYGTTSRQMAVLAALLLLLRMLLGVAAPSAATATIAPPPFVGRWVGATQSLPNSKLPQNPLLGNGHVGILLDSRVTSPQRGQAVFVLHNTTRCGSQNDWPWIGHNLTLQQCEANCTASARCGAFSYCDAAAGATGCAVPRLGMTSRCFQFADMSQCEGSQVGWTSGLRQPGRLPSAPGVPTNVTLDLWFGSNSLWAVNACPGPSHTAGVDGNTNRSGPFNPRWAPPFAPACAHRIALGGLSFQLPARGPVVLTMEQPIGRPRVEVGVSSELGNFSLTACLHPVENILVVNITSSSSAVVSVSTWALNSSASPSRAAVHGAVGTVTRQAVNSSGGFVLHTGLRCGGDLGLIGHNLTLQQCEANCTASARCGAFSYCDAAAGATGCAVPTAGMTSRCFQFADMSQCEGSQVGWTSGLKRVPRPKPDKQIVAALATASAAIDSWGPSSTAAGYADGTFVQGRTVVASTVSLAPSEVVSVFTVFADNSLVGPDTNATVPVTKLALGRASAAAGTGGTAAALGDATDGWWLEFWQQSSIRLPTRPAIERYWCATRAAICNVNLHVGLVGMHSTSFVRFWHNCVVFLWTGLVRSILSAL